MDLHPNAATDSLDAASVETGDGNGVETGDGEGVEGGDAPVPRRMRTDRLVLRRVHPDDVALDRLHALFADVADPGEVFDLCGWDHHEDDARTREYLHRRAEQWERGEVYEYVLESRTGGEGDRKYVGTACIEVSEDDGSGEFGFWLRKPHWGRGFCGEGTDALVHASFECLDAPYVVAGCLPANDRSRRAIEKFVRRYGGAYFGSPPIVSDSGDGVSDSGSEGSEEGDVVGHHEWVITREQFESGEEGISTLIPGVSYGDVEF